MLYRVIISCVNGTTLYSGNYADEKSARKLAARQLKEKFFDETGLEQSDDGLHWETI